ncbi:hypothetical protein M1432_01020 [Patescibacteria group bacterium]|nr:hypothetical protein [Patescibacteria group bacterium]
MPEVNRFNIAEGRIAFVIKAGRVQWSSVGDIVIARLAQDANFVSLEKRGAQLIFTYFSVEAGSASLPVDASTLDAARDHSFLLSWSISEDKIEIFIDGTLRGTQPIHVETPSVPQQ